MYTYTAVKSCSHNTETFLTIQFVYDRPLPKPDSHSVTDASVLYHSYGNIISSSAWMISESLWTFIQLFFSTDYRPFPFPCCCFMLMFQLFGGHKGQSSRSDSCCRLFLLITSWDVIIETHKHIVRDCKALTFQCKHRSQSTWIVNSGFQLLLTPFQAASAKLLCTVCVRN